MAHAKICMMTRCPDKSAARVTDGEKRLDLCRRHTEVVEKIYPDQIEVTAYYDEEFRNERREH